MEQFLLWSEEAKENFDKYYDLLMAMAGSVVYVGELGSGNVAKLRSGDCSIEYCGSV